MDVIFPFFIHGISKLPTALFPFFVSGALTRVAYHYCNVCGMPLILFSPLLSYLSLPIHLWLSSLPLRVSAGFLPLIPVSRFSFSHMLVNGILSRIPSQWSFGVPDEALA